MAYSLDFIRKVLSVREKEGLTIVEVANRFSIGVASVVRWIKNVDRKPQGFRKHKIDLDALRQDILDYPDAYQYERAAHFCVAQNAIFLTLRKLEVTYKKNSDAPQGGRITHDVSSRAISLSMRSQTGLLSTLMKGRISAIGALTEKLLVTIGLFEVNINADVFHGWII